MRELYKPWYLATGINRAKQFLAPPVLDGNSFFLPKNSLLHFNTFSEILSGPTDKDYIFSAEKKVVVSNVLKYSGMPIGNFRNASGFSIASVVRELKANRGSNTIKYPDKQEKVEDTSLFVLNYNSLMPAYKYTNTPTVLYSKWLNTMETIVENVNQNLDTTLRQQFILIEIPNTIPAKTILLDKASKPMSKQVLDIFNTYKLLTLLDIWKYLSYKLHKDSVLSKLNSKKLDKVNILFKYKNKYSVLNMATLFHLANLYPLVDNEALNDNDEDTEVKTKHNKKNAIDDYDVKIDKRNPLQARGAMLLLLLKIISNGAVTYAEALNSNNDIIDSSNLKLSTGAYNTTLLSLSNSDKDDFNFEDEDIVKLSDDISVPTTEELPDVVVTEDTIEDKEEEIDFIPKEEEDFTQALKVEEFTAVSEEVESEEETLEELFTEDKAKVKKNNLSKIKKAIDNGEISKNLGEQLTNVVENQEFLPSPYGEEGGYLGKYLTIDPKDAILDEADTIIPAIDITVNPKGLTVDEKNELELYLKDLDIYNKDVLNAIDKTYVKKLHKKFLVASVYKMQDAGLIISDYTVREDKDSLGAFEVHTIETTTLKGKKNKNWIKLPTLSENAKYQISGVHYALRRQHSDIPLRKIDFNKVVMSTYYGKLFVTKADSKLKDFGYWLFKELSLMGGNTDEATRVTNLIARDSLVYDANLPKIYTYFSRYIKSFNYKNYKYEFHYPSRIALVNNDEKLLKKIEGDKYTIIAYNENDNLYYVLDKTSQLWMYNANVNDGSQFSKGRSKDYNIYSILDIDLTKSVNESLIIKIFRKKLPLVLLLTYYKGLEPLLKLLKADYKIVDKRERYNPNEYLGYTFKDSRLLISKDNTLVSIIFAGFDLIEKEIRDVSLKSLNKKSTFSLLFSNLDLDKSYINEILLMEAMFIDPISETILKELKLPTRFIGLLIKAAELLVDDNYRNPVYDGELLIKSSERMVGFMYNELVKSTRTFKNKEDFSRSNMVIEPYAVWKNIGDDSTSTLVKQLNPVDSLKQIEEVTKIGSGGMSKDSVTKAARAYHPSAVGVISEATKDSSAVGISAYLSSVPNLNNVLGIKTGKEENGVAGRFSTSALLSPFVEYEAPKRAGFISIQNGHVAPIENAELPYIRTIEEMTIAYRVGKEFAFMAQEDGIVTKISDNEIEVKYNSGLVDAAILGNWSTRPESGKAFKNTVITDLKENDKFSKGDAISYNKAFFQKDYLFKGKLIYKMAAYANVGLAEEQLTYEDSSMVTSNVYKKMVTNVYHTQGVIFKTSDTLIDVPKANTKLKSDSYLYTIMNATVSSDSLLSTSVIESLQEIKNNSAVAGKEGTLDFVEIFYNANIDDLSDSFKLLIKDKKLVRKADQVTNQYSVDGKPLQKGELHMVYYISSSQDAGGGEKIVIANQLKSIIGDVVPYDMETQSGIPVDLLFSKISVENRVVNSAYIMGAVNLLLDAEANELIKIWNE